MKIQNLNDVLAQELRELLGAEECVYDKFKKFVKKVTDPELAECLDRHRDQADMHARRLRKVLADLSEKTKGLNCAAIEGMFDDINGAMKSRKLSDHLADIYAVGGAMKIISYKIACYVELIPAARELGLEELNVDEKLEQNLDGHRDSLRDLQQIGQRLLKEEVTFPSDHPISGEAGGRSEKEDEELSEEDLEPMATPIGSHEREQPEEQDEHRSGSAQGPARTFQDDDEMDDEVPEENIHPARRT